MTPDAPLPGLADEPAAGRAVVRCDECGYPLTTARAKRRGVGDVCAHKRGWRDVRRPGRFEVEQEGLWGAS